MEIIRLLKILPSFVTSVRQKYSRVAGHKLFARFDSFKSDKCHAPMTQIVNSGGIRLTAVVDKAGEGVGSRAILWELDSSDALVENGGLLDEKSDAFKTGELIEGNGIVRDVLNVMQNHGGDERFEKFFGVGAQIVDLVVEGRELFEGGCKDEPLEHVCEVFNVGGGRGLGVGDEVVDGEI